MYWHDMNHMTVYNQFKYLKSDFYQSDVVHLLLGHPVQFNQLQIFQNLYSIIILFLMIHIIYIILVFKSV